MASNPPFELEDQTDEDFFDKLVDDDDDDVNVGGGGLKSTGLAKADIILDGDESDEVKIFANLSINEGGGNAAIQNDGESGNGKEVVEARGVTGSDDSVGEPRVESKEHLRQDDENVGEQRVESKEHIKQDDENVGEQRVEAKEQRTGNGQEILPVVSSSSFGFDNGHASENGDMTSEAMSILRSESGGSAAGGVKEVQWSSFSDTAEHASGGLGSSSDFFTDFGEGIVENIQGEAKTLSTNETIKNNATEISHSYSEYQGGNAAVNEQSANGADVNSTEYWENLYPGWKYDASTGQWYQLDGCDGTLNGQENFASAVGNVKGNFDEGGESQWAISNVQASQVSYAQETAQSAIGTVSQFSTTEDASGLNQFSQQTGEYQYPAHMVFDPQYPGWYYDTLTQEWCSLETYHMSAASTDHTINQQPQNGFLSSEAYSQGNSQSFNSNALQGLTSEGLNQNWATSFSDYNQQGTTAYQPEVAMESRPAVSSSEGQSRQSSYDFDVYSNSHVGQQNLSDSREMLASYDKTNWNSDNSNWNGLHSYVSTDNALQQLNHIPQGEQNGPVRYSNDIYGSQNAASVSQPFIPNGHHAPYAPNEGRSSAGRPPHALVTFGFGGKLVVMKDSSTSGFSSFGSKDPDGGLISILNLMEIVDVSNGPSGTGAGTCNYFHSLCHQSFPGPLVGGNAGSKELNRWIDERIAHCDSLDVGHGKSEALKLLLSLLKIAWQHYGKLRSFGANTGLMENDLPESAVAKLFASAKKNGSQFGEYSAITKCFMTLPSEAQLQTTAVEVQNLLISGRKKEALQHAQEGQLWEFALILARQLGDQFYADTVKQMAVSQLIVGSPLRTLCLLIAKKPEEVFSTNVMAIGNMPGAVHMSPQSAQNVGYSMLDNWEENLAVITANRTENDNLVIIHLGDCLWKERNDVTAAHICYLVAEADFEMYSDSARLCLIGADHWNFPRTYASPEAIQRTEAFEYSKVLGNSQFVSLPLQPYKLIYAHMLAEVGRISESLKYCQAVSKSLKTGRSPESDTLKQLLASLEDRIKTHQQSGYAATLAPAKIMGKLFSLIDNTAHRVVGGLPPPVPPTSQGSGQGNENYFQTSGPKISGSQSTMAMSSLTPSASMEPISQWAVDGSRMTMPNRSNSEPDIGRFPRPDQTGSANEATSSSTEGKQSGTTRTSRFGRLNFGAQILQKTVSLVLKPRQGREAKLGDTNKFYYDEKLKRWVEEGAEPPAEESALPPPPPTAAFHPTFQNEKSDHTSQNALYSGLHATDHIHSPEPTNSAPLGSSSGIPAIPPSSNQFSARGRMGVRSRYVDTFNKGGGSSTTLFQAPSVPSAKPASVAGPKFFIPTAAPSNDRTFSTQVGTESRDEVSESGESSSMSMSDHLQNLAPSPPGTMQRFPSVDNIPSRGTMGGQNSSLASQSRRTASWNEIRSDTYSPHTTTEMSSPPLSSFMPSNRPQGSLPMNGGSFGDDLQEVEL